MSQFFTMGGYAFYVWTSYAVFALGLIAVVIGPLFRQRRIKHRLLRTSPSVSDQPSATQ